MRSLHVIVLNNKTNRKNQSLNNYLHRQQLAPFNTRQFGIAFPLFLAEEGNHLSESRYFRGVGLLLSGFPCTCEILSLLSRGEGGRFFWKFTVINY